MTQPRSIKTFLAPRPVAETLGTQLRRAALRSVVLMSFLAAPILGVYALPGSAPFGVGDLGYAPSVPAEVVAGESRTERILERRECWTGEAPAGVDVPGGVVMTLVGGGVRYFGSDARVGQALDHIFAEADPRISSVAGFCR